MHISFGAMVAPIAEQLSVQGYVARDKTHLAAWQKDADAITRLAVRGLLAPTYSRSARTRLLKMICADVMKTEE